MASIQEQLKHIRFANDEWYDEHRKLVSPYYIHVLQSNINHVPCRLIGELAQLSRRATPDIRSASSTPRLETTASVHESESSRSRSDEGSTAR
ncbi:hypothetical protein VI817_004764 [Penicillium citrinum]|nr:hypothetical protein VI817_004764 [Penicillium citrinum]